MDEGLRRAMMRPNGVKNCAGPCGRELPATKDWFDKDVSRDDGWSNWCKGCRKERRQAQKLQRAADSMEQFDELLMEQLRAAKPGGTDVPHLAEIYQTLMGLIGGVQGYSIQVLATYKAAKPGSVTRQKILADMQRMAGVLSDSKKVQMPPELMNDADLVAEVERRAAKIRAGVQYLNGTADPAPKEDEPPTQEG